MERRLKNKYAEMLSINELENLSLDELKCKAETQIEGVVHETIEECVLNDYMIFLH